MKIHIHQKPAVPPVGYRRLNRSRVTVATGRARTTGTRRTTEREFVPLMSTINPPGVVRFGVRNHSRQNRPQ